MTADEALRRVEEENVNELNHKNDIRNLMDWCELENYPNHEPPEEYRRSAGEIGQLILSMLKIVPWQLVEQLKIYLETPRDQVHNENHSNYFL